MTTPVLGGPIAVLSPTVQANVQNGPSLATLSDGRVISVWNYAAGANNEIQARFLNPDGTPVGPTFFVNSRFADMQIHAKVLALPDGGFVVAWEDWAYATAPFADWVLRAQIFDADGTRRGADFTVNTEPRSQQSDVTMTAVEGGGFFAAWVHYDTLAFDEYSSVRGQWFDASGSKIGGELIIGVSTIVGATAPEVTTLHDGRVAVTWLDKDIYATVLEPNSDQVGIPFVIGAVSSGAMRVSNPTLTALSDGGFVAIWTEDYSQVKGKVFHSDGSAAGDVFTMNASDSRPEWSAVPLVTELGDGRFVAVWGGESSNPYIFGKVFNSDGSDDSDVFRVVDTEVSTFHNPSITVLEDGRLLVAYSQAYPVPGVNGGGLEVLGKVLDLNPIVSSGTAGRDSLVGSMWGDTLSGGLGADTIDGGSGADRLNGMAGNDLLIGGDGNDTLLGGDGADRLRAGLGDDLLQGHAGNDLLFGEDGNDSLNGGLGNDEMYGGTGNDLMLGADGDDSMAGGVGNDTLLGGSGDDVLVGQVGQDVLRGGDGFDLLFGGLGKDTLEGGGSTDVFAFLSRQEAGNFGGRDVILDFSSGEDLIYLAEIDANENTPWVLDSFTFVVSAVFSGVAGELRYSQATGVLAGDVNGDAIADFQIQFVGQPALQITDLILFAA